MSQVKHRLSVASKQRGQVSLRLVSTEDEVLVRCLPSWLSGFSLTDWLPAALQVNVSGGTLAGTAKLFLDCLARCLRRAGRTTDDDGNLNSSHSRQSIRSPWVSLTPLVALLGHGTGNGTPGLPSHNGITTVDQPGIVRAIMQPPRYQVHVQ